MSEVQTFINKFKNFQNFKIDEINKVQFITISVSKSDNTNPLVIIPPYSFDGFAKIMTTIDNNFDIIKKKYNIIYAIYWGDEIKRKSIEISTILNKNCKNITNVDEKYKINEKFRITLANTANKIINKYKITSFTLLGKSAGGGISIHIAKKNKQVMFLFLVCPAISTIVKLNKTIKIILSWNRDDDKIPYEESLPLINNYIKNKNDFNFLSYETGGHELHDDFFKTNILYG